MELLSQWKLEAEFRKNAIKTNETSQGNNFHMLDTSLSGKASINKNIFCLLFLNSGPHPPTPENWLFFSQIIKNIMCLEGSNMPYKHWICIVTKKFRTFEPHPPTMSRKKSPIKNSWTTKVWYVLLQQETLPYWSLCSGRKYSFTLQVWNLNVKFCQFVFLYSCFVSLVCTKSALCSSGWSQIRFPISGNLYSAPE